MRIGYYKGKEVKVYENGDKYLIEFGNGVSITSTDLSEIEFKE